MYRRGQGVNLRGLSGIDRDSRGKDGLPSPGFLGLDVSFREGINPAEMMEEWNTMHHLAYIKSCKSWDTVFTISTGEFAVFLNHQPYV